MNTFLEVPKKIITSDGKRYFRQSRTLTVLTISDGKNRSIRRAANNDGKILNNRKNPTKRRKVLNRMSYFYLSVSNRMNKR